ncbi:MAG: radical SAM protein [Nanoarchaeota archaeon]|nr:radical SAM protein [Nanoarchaeota archaeon]
MKETYKRKLPKLDLNVTNRCNFKCAHCAFDSGIIKMPELTLGELKKILSDTKKLRGERFDITGGEPLVRNDIEQIIKIGKNLGYKIELVTNGYLLGKKKLKRFKSLGLDAIAISLDGSNPEIYNKIRNRNDKTFHKVINNIKLSKKYGFKTKVNTVVFSSNLEDIPNIIKLCLSIGVDEYGIYYFTPIGRGNRSNELAVEPIKWLNFIRTKLKPYENSPVKISLELPIIEREYWNKNLGCIANCEKSHLQILPNGNTYPCAILASYQKPVANLHDCSIGDIWKNQELWKKYWKNLNQLFKRLGGYCVDFQHAFNMKNYDLKKYRFVCPLRKFNLKNIK